MCSTTGDRIARICRAIEELASRSGQGAGEIRGASESAVAALAADRGGGAGSGEAAGSGGDSVADDSVAAAEGKGAMADDVAGRLAEIWAMVADADPELAKRLPGYLGTAD